MPGTELKNCSAESTAVICAGIQFSDEAQEQLEAGSLDRSVTPGEFLDALMAAGLPPDAVRFIAYALPKQKAIWWACQCLRLTADAEDELLGVIAAEAWVRDPSDENRRAAMTVAQELDLATPDAWAAVGAFWTGGSMAPPEHPEVPPGDELTGHALTGAVLLAAVRRDPEKAQDKQRSFVALGIEVANGANLWMSGDEIGGDGK